MKTGVIACCLLFASCASQAQRSRAYTEEVSRYRPKVVEDTVGVAGPPAPAPVVPPQLTVNQRVDAVLDSIDKISHLRKFADGFTIQVYSGQKREDANVTKKRMADEFPNLRADLQFQQPTFRVKTGAYYTRMEAQKDLVRIRKVFPNAILVPDKILIRN